MLSQYFSFYGRLNRKPYWLRHVVIYLILLVAIAIVMFAMGAFSISYDDAGELVIPDELYNLNKLATWGSLISVAFLIFFISSLSLATRRLHDRGRSGWWLVGYFVVSFILGAISEAFGTSPLSLIFDLVSVGIAIWFLVEVGFLKGTVGPNQFGPDPLGMATDPEVFGR